MREAFQLYQRNGRWMARYWNEAEQRYVKTLTLAATDEEAARKEAEDRRQPLLVPFLYDFWKDEGEYAKLKALRGKPLSPRYLALCRSVVRLYVEPYKSFKKMRVGDLLPVDLEKWQTWMAEQGTGARSANIALQAVRTAVRRRAKGRREPDPLPGVMKAEERPRERGILSIEEVEKIIDHPKGTTVHDRVVVLLGALAGLRLGEVRGLRWENVDLKGKKFNVLRSISADEKEPRAPKSGSSAQDLPLSDELIAELRALQAVTKDKTGYVLGIGGEPMGTTGLRNAFRRVLDAIGVKADKRKARRLSYHGLRHTFVSMSRVRGLPDWITQRLARHKTAALTTGVYSHENIIPFKDTQRQLSGPVKRKKAR